MILDVDFEWSIEQLNGLSDEAAERLEGLLWEVLDGVVCRQILPAAFERTDRLFGLKQMFWLELLDEQNGGNGPSAAIVRSAQSEGELELKNTMTIFECSDLDQWRAMRHGSLRSKALQDVDLMLGLLAALFKDPNSVQSVTIIFKPPKELLNGRVAEQDLPISMNIPFAFGKRFERVGDVVGWMFEEGLDLSGLQKFLD